ncbi:MAG: haloacid dehalogenase type II [Cohaesibacteraceae bacterium]|nr:haloacid dehalogenase type II [Cohaesibacteraceae bacterium]
MAQTVYVFDAFGTLFDVHAAVRKHASEIGPDASLLSEIWRQKQLEYSWVRTLMGSYRDFWSITEDALDYAFEKLPEANRDTRDQVLASYRELEAFSEVRDVLGCLKANGARTGILSNGSPQMLDAAVGSAGLKDVLDELISVHELKVFKTREETYDLVCTRFRVFPEAVSFQSSNRWDIAGASKFGFHTVWINRTGQPDEYSDHPPAMQLQDLNGLL